MPVHQLPQPAQFFFEFFITAVTFFIAPVGSDAIFSEVMHFVSTDLYFKRNRTHGHNSGMQRLITVCLGVSDVIIKITRHRVPQAVHHTDGIITIGNSVNQNP